MECDCSDVLSVNNCMTFVDVIPFAKCLANDLQRTYADVLPLIVYTVETYH